jgi:GNAT superfamily N-acetyltransferase
MQYQIRKAIADDTDSIWTTRNAAIMAQCVGFYSIADLHIWTDGVPTERFMQSVIDKWHVAVVDQTVVGTGIIDVASGHIDAVFVRPEMTRRGVGTSMMNYLETIALENRLCSLTLDSTLNAVNFHRRCGFTGEQQSEYKSPRGITLACVPMTKALKKAG